MDVSRRDLIKPGTTAAAAGGLLTAQTGQAQTPASGGQPMPPAPLGFNPADPALRFDLVIANADVLDPSQRLPVEFVDTRNNKRTGAKRLVPWLTVKGGRPWGRPPLPIPFTY